MTDHLAAAKQWLWQAEQVHVGDDATEFALIGIGHYLGAILDELAIHDERLRQIAKRPADPPITRIGVGLACGICGYTHPHTHNDTTTPPKTGVTT